MPKFKAKFQIRDQHGRYSGVPIDEIIDAPNIFVAKDLIDRKYGGVNFWGGLVPVQEQRTSSGSNTASSPGSSRGEPNGCLVLLGAIGIAIAMATGLLKTSDQPGTPDQAPSTPPPLESSGSSPQPAPAPVQATWGVFAVSPSTGESSYATGYTSEEEAKQAAINSCGNSDCNALNAFGPGYATLAESDNNWFFSHGHSSEGEAVNDALRQCEERDPGQNCRVTKTVNF